MGTLGGKGLNRQNRIFSSTLEMGERLGALSLSLSLSLDFSRLRAIRWVDEGTGLCFSLSCVTKRSLFQFWNWEFWKHLEIENFENILKLNWGFWKHLEIENFENIFKLRILRTSWNWGFWEHLEIEDFENILKLRIWRRLRNQLCWLWWVVVVVEGDITVIEDTNTQQ